MPFLLKTEPSVYSFADLQHDKSTVWDGVTNAQAVKNLREMSAGEKLVIYHTGDEKQAVGLARVIRVDVSDPKAPAVTLRAGVALAVPVTLAQLKKDRRFSDSPLLKQGRLSVVPLTLAQYRAIAG
jgi:predicted RNA-binding protein with PUA-like domain